MTIIHEFAPAKINLYLHITGREENGYHELDSLVVFANIGDEIALRTGKKFKFEVTGPQAEALKHAGDEDNLVVKAATSLASLTHHSLDIDLVLAKNLPVASGIGGGSSDAAATLRALARHWGLSSDDPRLFEIAARYGQDVPVCLKIENNYITSTGTITAPSLPTFPIVLINPGKGLPTPDVYKEYRKSSAPFSSLARFEKTPSTLHELVALLKARHNDLYEPACRLMPAIAQVMEVLGHSKDCLLARMSGSGATCFGIYKDEVSAKSACAQIRALYPKWWVESGATK